MKGALEGLKVKEGNHLYHWHGHSEMAALEYGHFLRCIPQLIDDDSMTGDMSGKWVIFRNGWLYDFTGFPSPSPAMAWARQLHRNEIDATWIVAKVDIAAHGVSPLSLLGDVLADVEYSGQPDLD